MHFDTSPRTLRTLAGMMRRDHRVIRWTMLKLGEKAEDVVTSPEQTVDRQLPTSSSNTSPYWS
jgi:small subunit ribosomal protein S6